MRFSWCARQARIVQSGVVPGAPRRHGLYCFFKLGGRQVVWLQCSHMAFGAASLEHPKRNYRTPCFPSAHPTTWSARFRKGCLSLVHDKRQEVASWSKGQPSFGKHVLATRHRKANNLAASGMDPYKSALFESMMDTLGIEPRAFRMRSGCGNYTMCPMVDCQF